MDEVKDKMKGLIKKVNNPFSSSTPFKGQGRVLGSGTSSSTPSNSTLLNPRAPPVRPNAKRVPESKPIAKSTANPNPTQFSPYDPLITSSSSTSTSISSSPSPFQCPVCARTFPTESEVSSHLDSCLTPQPESTELKKSAPHKVEEFLSGNPTENSIEVMKNCWVMLSESRAVKIFGRLEWGIQKSERPLVKLKVG